MATIPLTDAEVKARFNLMCCVNSGNGILPTMAFVERYNTLINTLTELGIGDDDKQIKDFLGPLSAEWRDYSLVQLWRRRYPVS